MSVHREYMGTIYPSSRSLYLSIHTGCLSSFRLLPLVGGETLGQGYGIVYPERRISLFRLSYVVALNAKHK